SEEPQTTAEPVEPDGAEPAALAAEEPQAAAEAVTAEAVAAPQAEAVAAEAVAEPQAEAVTAEIAASGVASGSLVPADEEVAVSPERLMGVMDPQVMAGGQQVKLPPWAIRLDDLEGDGATAGGDEIASVAGSTSDPEAASATEAEAADAMVAEGGPAGDDAVEAEVTPAVAEAEPVGAVAGGEQHGAEAPHGLLGSIPVLRPVGSWWNRANGNGAHGDGDHGEG
ncbi:MAG TPA: hypothetical protein VFW86_05660, partial [Candidatus Limnocylindrales bacterium]|nr:hypothetical protein [Candidatus Limnocylindrales bacterium]